MVYQSKRFHFVWHNYEESTIDHLKSLYPTFVTFMIVGKETGELGETPHLQCYCETVKKVTIVGLRAKLGDVSKILIAKGSAQDNIVYCSKEGDVAVNVGTTMKQGKRTDLAELKQKIDDGVTWDDLWEDDFTLMLQYRRGVEEYANLRRRRTRDVPEVKIWWGKTGTGKTRGAYDLAHELYGDDIYSWSGTKWFDGYRGQKVVLFDEFDGGEKQEIPYDYWKRLTDRYKVQVQTKGGFANFCPEVIILTSNVNPMYWWCNEQKPYDWKEQFDRRVTEIKEFK